MSRTASGSDINEKNYSIFFPIDRLAKVGAAAYYDFDCLIQSITITSNPKIDFFSPWTAVLIFVFYTLFKQLLHHKTQAECGINGIVQEVFVVRISYIRISAEISNNSPNF